MKIKKILLSGVILLPIIGITAITQASNQEREQMIDRMGTGSIHQGKEKMDEIKSILEKQKAGTTLTTDEQDKLDNFQANNQNREKFGSGMINGEKMDEIKSILEKQKAGTTLTTDEQAKLDDFKTNNMNKSNSKTIVKKVDNKKLSDTNKKAIDNVVNNFFTNVSSLDNDAKKVKLETYKSKIESVLEKIQKSNYSETKKTTYNNMLNYIVEKIDLELNNIDSQSTTDDLSIDDLLK